MFPANARAAPLMAWCCLLCTIVAASLPCCCSTVEGGHLRFATAHILPLSKGLGQAQNVEIKIGNSDLMQETTAMHYCDMFKQTVGFRATQVPQELVQAAVAFGPCGLCLPTALC